MMKKISWRPILFRIIGVTAIAGGYIAFTDFGARLIPLFKQFVANSYDAFEMFTVLTSFFLGVVALVWVGGRFIILRNFSSTWLYFAILPITAWLIELYKVGPVFKMDQILTSSLVYVCMYVLIQKIIFFVHKEWYIPVSHEGMRHVGLEEPGKTSSNTLRLAILILIVIVLLILHPDDIATTMRRVVSPVTYFISLF